MKWKNEYGDWIFTEIISFIFLVFVFIVLKINEQTFRFRGKK